MPDMTAAAPVLRPRWPAIPAAWRFVRVPAIGAAAGALLAVLLLCAITIAFAPDQHAGAIVAAIVVLLYAGGGALIASVLTARIAGEPASPDRERW